MTFKQTRIIRQRHYDQVTKLIYKINIGTACFSLSSYHCTVMKFLQAIFVLAGFQLILAQDITDCTDIAAGLNTLPITPVTGKELIKIIINTGLN